MKKKLLVAITALLALIAIVSCDMGGTEIVNYEVPQWLIDYGTVYATNTMNDTRNGAIEGQMYFVGISSTRNCIELIYKIKGNGPDASSDKEVRYKQEDVPRLINPSYSGAPILMRYPNDKIVEIVADNGTMYYEIELIIEEGKDWITEAPMLTFECRPGDNPANSDPNYHGDEYGFRYLPL